MAAALRSGAGEPLKVILDYIECKARLGYTRLKGSADKEGGKGGRREREYDLSRNTAVLKLG